MNDPAAFPALGRPRDDLAAGVRGQRVEQHVILDRRDVMPRQSLSQVIVVAAALAVLMGTPGVAAAQDATPAAGPAATPSTRPAAFLWEATGGPVPLDYVMDVTVAPDGN